MSIDIIARGMAGNAITNLQTEIENRESSDELLVGEIDEVRAIAEGAQISLSVPSYNILVATLNSATSSLYKAGQTIYVQTVGVPDLWIYEVSKESVTYPYTTDDAMIQAMVDAAAQSPASTIQIGYYRVAMLENLTSYLKDYTFIKNVTITGGDNPEPLEIKANQYTAYTSSIGSLRLVVNPVHFSIFTLSYLEFQTGNTFSGIARDPTVLRFQGDDVDENNLLVPLPNKHYIVLFKRLAGSTDDKVVGIVTSQEV